MQLDRLNDEEGRLAALDRYRVLDTGPELAFERITALVKSVLEVPICAVTFIARDRQWFKAIQGLAAQETTRAAAFCHHTIQLRDAMIVTDAHADPRFADNPLVVGPPYIRSYAGVPLTTPEGFNLGALCVIDSKPRSYSAEQIGVLRRFADLVVGELEARSMTLRDALTGSLTREGMIDAMRAQVAIFEETGRTASLLLFAVDRFSTVNEERGRSVGDQILREVAECFRRSIRGGDILARFGGDTHAVLLPGLSAYEAVACAERLRSRAAQLQFPAAADLRVTVSCGIAALQRGYSLELWRAGAEATLFAAKKRGHNQCISADALR